MGENKMCLSIGGNLFWFGVAILITRFCLFVPGWAKTECDPLYIIAVIGFLLYCVAWYSLVYRDRDDEYYAYTNSSIVTQYAAGAAAILRWICVSCLFAFMLKMVWNSGVWKPVFWVSAGLLQLVFIWFQSENFDGRAGILSGLADYEFSCMLFVFMTFSWVPMITYYSII